MQGRGGVIFLSFCRVGAETYGVADQNTRPVLNRRVAPNWRAGPWVDSKRHLWVTIEAVDGVLDRISVTEAEVWGTLYPWLSTGYEFEVGGDGCREDGGGGQSKTRSNCFGTLLKIGKRLHKAYGTWHGRAERL